MVHRMLSTTLLVPVSFAVIAGCSRPTAIPPGFGVLGTTIPQSAESIPIPEGFTEKLPQSPAVDTAWTGAESAAGYVLFARNYLTTVLPSAQPVRGEITDQITSFSSLGEYEPATFSIHALEALSEVRVTATALRRGGGGVIPASYVDVRSVRCWPKRVWKNPPVRQFSMAPWFLEKRASLDVPAGRSQRYWITVFVPADVKAGLYHGTVHVEAKGRVMKHMKLQMRVLPLVLRTPPTRQGMYYHLLDPMAEASDSPLDTSLQTRDIVNMREHGMNTAMIMLYPALKGTMRDGEVAYDVSPIAHFVETGLAVGMDGCIWNTTMDPFLPRYDGPGTLGQNTRGFVQSFVARGWPIPTLSYGDESDAHDTWARRRTSASSSGPAPRR